MDKDEINNNIEIIDDIYYHCGACGFKIDYGVAECPECKTVQVWFSR